MKRFFVSQCTYRCVVLPDTVRYLGVDPWFVSQCTYRCVVLPDSSCIFPPRPRTLVSMHLQVRGAP